MNTFNCDIEMSKWLLENKSIRANNDEDFRISCFNSNFGVDYHDK